MILPVQRIVRTRIAEAVPLSTASPADDPALAVIVVDVPPRRALGDLAVPLAFELARRLRKAPRDHRAGDRRPARARSTGSRGSRRRPTATSTSSSIASHHLDAWLTGGDAAPRPIRRKGHRRAHRDQPEQGGAHRPPAQRRARRRVRPAAPLSGPRRRDPELHRRHRRPGRRRRGRLPRAREARTSTAFARIADTHALRLLLLGPLRARDRVVRGGQGPAARSASAALHDIEHGGNDTAAIAQLHRRSHRPPPPRNDGAAEHRLRPADVGGRHPAPALLDPRLRVPEAAPAPSSCRPKAS